MAFKFDQNPLDTNPLFSGAQQGSAGKEKQTAGRKKTAEKLILELRDKCDADDFLETEQDAHSGATSGGGGATTDAAKDAIAALVALGYSQTDSMRAVRAVSPSDDMSVDSILKLALKNI